MAAYRADLMSREAFTATHEAYPPDRKGHQRVQKPFVATAIGTIATYRAILVSRGALTSSWKSLPARSEALHRRV
jgi:hypothetical protein